MCFLFIAQVAAVPVPLNVVRGHSHSPGADVSAETLRNIDSMCGIFVYVYDKKTKKVGKYTIDI